MKSKILAGIFIILSMGAFAEEEKMNELLELEKNALAASGHPLNETTQHKNPNYAPEYFAEYQDNLFCKMSDKHKMQYENGGGRELSDKNGSPAHMKSVLSSSAMTFNLLGNGEIPAKEGNEYFVPGTYKIEYEKKLLTLKKSSRPAHLDAFLWDKGSNAIFCEMKMTEWMKIRGKNDLLSSSYFDDRRYYFNMKNDNVALSAFKKLRDSLCENMIKGAQKKGYNPHRFTHYDAWQMYKHILGIYNMRSDLTKEEIKLPKNGISEFLPELEKVVLANVIFEPPVDAFSDENVRKEYTELQKSEHGEFDIFKHCVEESGVIEAFKKDCGIEFSVELLTAAQFMDCFDISDNHKQYLQRYRLDK